MSALPGPSAEANPLPGPGDSVLGGAGAERAGQPGSVPSPSTCGRSRFLELWAHQVGPSFHPSSSSARPLLPLRSLIPTPHKLPSPPCTATPPALQCQLACVPRPDPPLSPGCRCHLLDDNAPSTALHPILT